VQTFRKRRAGLSATAGLSCLCLPQIRTEIFTLNYIIFTLNFFCFMRLVHYIDIKLCVFDSLLILIFWFLIIFYNLRKYYFSNRVIQIWNSLPDSVVESNSINNFKNNLDKFWQNEDVKFNWKANLTSAGSRSLSLT